MTSLQLTDSDIPDLSGKVAIITGGASGIGLATARILARHHATCHILDISGPHADDGPNPENITFRTCNVVSWLELRTAFMSVGHVDIVVANAGVSQNVNHFADTFDSEGLLEEPVYPVIDVNLKAVLNTVKLGLSAFHRQGSGGSIVITSSATGLSPEQSLPVYSAVKCGVIGLVRALRSTIPYTHGATINTVAPAATITRLLPANLAAPIIQAGAPVSSAEHVGLAVAFSAVGYQDTQVEGYGRDTSEMISSRGRWNGRTILTLGDTWTEVEQPLATLRPQWFGDYTTKMTAFQQSLTDMRPLLSNGSSQEEDTQLKPQL
ncbi:hypothetical protein E4T39_04198 [Aureobasidium subglaciale]|nr:hypothetical protein E4T39_04198 [Aureobasidium subglaciale]